MTLETISTFQNFTRNGRSLGKTLNDRMELFIPLFAFGVVGIRFGFLTLRLEFGLETFAMLVWEW